MSILFYYIIGSFTPLYLVYTIMSARGYKLFNDHNLIEGAIRIKSSASQIITLHVGRHHCIRPTQEHRAHSKFVATQANL